MNNIKAEDNKDLLKWFEFEVKKDHYNPLGIDVNTSYTLDKLRDEIMRRLQKAACARHDV